MANQRKNGKDFHDKYWRELPSTNHRFFTIMIHSFKHEMIIPKKFIDNFREREKLSPLCTLIGPSNNKWIVEISEREDKTVAFSDGWEIFVNDHGVELCDFLVFRYVGDSSFKVLIFAASACEREASYFATNNGSSSFGNISAQKTVERFKLPSTNENSTVGENEEEDPFWVAVGDEDSEKINKFGRKKTSARVKVPQICHISKRRKLKPEEKHRSARMANDHLKTMNQKVPAFPITLQATNVYRGFQLTVPKKWAKKHMLREIHDVELRVPKEGRSWIVGCRWNTSSDQCHLRAQWRIFVLDNTLETYDSCVFELIQKGKLNGKVKPIFTVHIFRAIDICVPVIEARKMV